MSSSSCAICEGPFTPKRRSEKYCGDECRAEARRRQYRVPALPPATCPTCGETFQPARATNRRCPACCTADPKGRRLATLREQPQTEEGRSELEYLREQVRELRTELRNRRASEGWHAELLEHVRQTIRAFPPVPAPRPAPARARKKVREDAVLLLSDLHFGERISVEETGGLGGYDVDTAVRRLEHLSDTVRRFLLETMAGYTFETLHVIGLGDYVSGNIHEEITESNELEIVDQAQYGALVVAQFLRELAAAFPRVTFTSVVGNHGRLSKKPRAKRRHVNWDYVLASEVALMLRDQPNLEFHIPRSFWALREIRGRRFLAMHGDNIRGWMGIPWYGIDRAVSRLQEILAASDRYFDYVVLGHFHNLGTLQKTRGEKIINGSLKGPDEYSIGLGLASEPVQLLFGVHDEHAKTWQLACGFGGATGPPSRYAYDVSRPAWEQAPA